MNTFSELWYKLNIFFFPVSHQPLSLFSNIIRILCQFPCFIQFRFFYVYFLSLALLFASSIVAFNIYCKWWVECVVNRLILLWLVRRSCTPCQTHFHLLSIFNVSTWIRWTNISDVFCMRMCMCLCVCVYLSI